jgi:hypothetical protein
MGVVITSTLGPTHHFDATENAIPWMELSPKWWYQLRVNVSERSLTVQAWPQWIEHMIETPRRITGKEESDDIHVKQLHDVLRDAVKRRVVGIRPWDKKMGSGFAVLFSGGLDCTVLAALAQEYAGNHPLSNQHCLFSSFRRGIIIIITLDGIDMFLGFSFCFIFHIDFTTRVVRVMGEENGWISSMSVLVSRNSTLRPIGSRRWHRWRSYGRCSHIDNFASFVSTSDVTNSNVLKRGRPFSRPFPLNDLSWTTTSQLSYILRLGELDSI